MASREEQEYSSQAPAPYIGQFLQKGIFPYAQQFLQQQFQNYGQADSSPFTYTGQRVAGFDPREQYGMQLADQAIGSYRPYLGQQAGLLDEAARFTKGGMGRGVREITRGLGRGRGLTGEATGLTRGAQFTQPGLGDFQGSLPEYGGARGGLGRAERSGYRSTRGFDPRGIGRFYDPFEEDVVQQTLTDVREGLSKGDMALRDEAVSSGAFGGARSRLRRGELAGDVARGAAEAIGGIRSGGYRDAAGRAQQAFEAQQGRMAGLGGLQSQLAEMEGGLAGAEAQAKLARGEALNQSEQMAVNNAMQRGQQLGQFGQQQFGMGLQGGQGLAGLGYSGAQGLGQIGQQYAGMAQALPTLQQQDIQGMMGMGGLGRGREQSLMDLNYQNFVGQYNLPMQTLQNVGALTASLGPMAGGYGYAGGSPTTNMNYAPTGPIGPGLQPPQGQGPTGPAMGSAVPSIARWNGGTSSGAGGLQPQAAQPGIPSLYSGNAGAW